MSRRFQGQVAVVTGGGSGMGLAAAQLLVAEGAAVAINDVRPDAAEEAVAELSSHGEAIAVPGSVASRDEAWANLGAVLDRFGRVDVLLANAGAPMKGRAEDYATWRESLGVNLDGIFFWAQAVAKESMIPNRRGAMVFTSSIAGVTASMDDIGYTASKHGVVGMTKALAVEWARYGIRVNSIAPGLTDSLMMRRQMAVDRPGRDRFGRIPMRRPAQPEEQARAMLFLASDDASYITGITLPVDGGQLALSSGLSPHPLE